MEVHLIFKNKKISKNGSSSKNISEMAPLVMFSKLKLNIGIYGYTQIIAIENFQRWVLFLDNFEPDFKVFWIFNIFRRSNMSFIQKNIFDKLCKLINNFIQLMSLFVQEGGTPITLYFEDCQFRNFCHTKCTPTWCT